MWVPEWFVIVIVVFIVILLTRLGQLHNHVEELRDCVDRLEGKGVGDVDDKQEETGDSGGN